MDTRSQALTRARQLTLSDYIPLPLKATWARDVVLVVGFSLLTALCAQISIRLGDNPVPITFQTLAVLLGGAALGSKRGGLAMLLYVLEGAVGLPFYASGNHGLAVLFGATGGYLLAYPVVGLLTGWLAERGWDRSYFRTVAAMVLGSLIIYAFGVTWLAFYTNKGLGYALSNGFYPFIPLDTVKLLIAAGVLPGTWFLTRKK